MSKSLNWWKTKQLKKHQEIAKYKKVYGLLHCSATNPRQMWMSRLIDYQKLLRSLVFIEENITRLDPKKHVKVVAEIQNEAIELSVTERRLRQVNTVLADLHSPMFIGDAKTLLGMRTTY